MASLHFYSPISLAMAMAITILTSLIPLTISSLPFDRSYVEFLQPNVTFSFIQWIDDNGVFLISRNQSFAARLSTRATSEQPQFYLSVVHRSTYTVIWSANMSSPVSEDYSFSLTSRGMTVADGSGSTKWSTPELGAPVASIMLQETGNLVLLDKLNNSLWESFSYPTDTIVTGQRLQVGTSLMNSIPGSSNYELVVSEDDVLLQWNQQMYWSMSRDTRAYKVANSPSSFLELNSTGLYLLGTNPDVTVIQLNLAAATFRIATVQLDGSFVISGIINGTLVQQFVAPLGACQIPLFCGKLGLCDSLGDSTLHGFCSCPQGFNNILQSVNGCAPIDRTLSLPSYSCSSRNNPRRYEYLELTMGTDYFALNFISPLELRVNVSACQDLCSESCTCSALFHDNSSGSCYLLHNDIGSVYWSSNEPDRIGYIKTTFESSDRAINLRRDLSRNGFAIVLSLGLFLLLVFVVGGIIWLRRKRIVDVKTHDLPFPRDELGSMLSFPIRFSYDDLADATGNFTSHVGSGGFGDVFRGTLPDGSTVAVKRIKDLNGRRTEEFYGEIAVIGSVRHTNLVKLKGFCAEAGSRMLVLEYMDRGSLDKVLFGHGPPLGWQERFEIALGIARGLAYLHSDCEPRIIHCDVKPENVLLNEKLQVKISDFGISKLIGTDESSRLTTLRGTIGYLAPEWLLSHAINDRMDVYSYGMVLLEIVRGQRNCPAPMHNRKRSTTSLRFDPGSVYFPLHVLQMHTEGRYLELADPRLEQSMADEEVEKLVRVALCCLHRHPLMRPSMASVVQMLTGLIPITEPITELLDYLRLYGQRLSQASVAEETS